MSTSRIRPIAIGVIWRGRQLLVQHGVDPERGGEYFRPPGGAIEFGERAADALRREFREELQAELVDVRLMTVLENPFVFMGTEHHEIVFVFEAHVADRRFYDREEFTVHETDRQARASWKAFEELSADVGRLYPTGLVQLLHARVTVA